MKPGLPAALLVAAAVSAALLTSPETAASGAGSPEPAAGRSAYFIRFGVDAKPGVDWSGSVEPAPLRLTSWQFAPGEEVSASGWKCATSEDYYWDTPYEARMGPTAGRHKVTRKGVVVEYEAGRKGPIKVTTAQGEFSFTPDDSLWTAPRRFLDGRVEVRAAPPIGRLSEGPDAEDYPALLAAGDGTLWLAYTTYTGDGDRLFVRRRMGRSWSEPEALTPGGRDLFRVALGEDAAGRIWAVWADQVDGNFDLYARYFEAGEWSGTQRLTTAPASDIYHKLARDAAGRLYLVYQSARAGNFDIYLRVLEDGAWSDEIQVSSDPANDWEPAVAASGDEAFILWDTYSKRNYDVVGRPYRNGKLGEFVSIAATGAFEARVSAQYDRQGRLWLAWEEGDWNWGKDYGRHTPESGRGLIVKRQTRVAVLAGGRLLEPASPFAEALPEEFRQAFHNPKILLDANGAPWVVFRYRVNLPRTKGRRVNRGHWRMALTGYGNGRWMPMLDLPDGFGRLDAGFAAAFTNDGRLALAWASDVRQWPGGVVEDQDLCWAAVPPLPASEAPALAAFRPSGERFPPSHPNEGADLRRVRSYRTKIGGRTYRIVRGDVHRHTALSWDGNRDGSLHDAYRYAMDAASLDFLGVCDHHGDTLIPYNWWMIQKAADLFFIPGRFVPLYSYERSLPFPNGHRNVLLSERGRPVLPSSPAEQRGEEGAAKLYEYLRRYDGIVTSHTSATGAGTDWRDSDPVLEPVVEIYQGYRDSYESPDGPRHPASGRNNKYAAGYVWNAWAKGIKLGVQSSSDHVSTHMSYAAVYLDRLDRKAIIEGLRARRSYAATDNLIIEMRVNGRFMGEIFETREQPVLEASILGTGPIERVEVVKNNRIVYTAAGSGAELKFTYTDAAAEAGESYYYVRVIQKNGQVGWGSPIWVRRPE